MMIKAIIFDMDGLMIDSENATYRVFKKVLANYGYNMTKDFYVTLLGNTRPTVTKKYKQEFGEDFDVDKYIKEGYDVLEAEFISEGIPVKKGLVNLLKYLKDNNYKTIVASSSIKARVQNVIETLNIDQYFDDIICGDDVQNGKPDPEIFLKACDKLGIDVSEAIVLEDSEAGIEASYKANIKVICIPDMKYPSTKHQEMTYKIADSLDDVVCILK